MNGNFISPLGLWPDGLLCRFWTCPPAPPPVSSLPHILLVLFLSRILTNTQAQSPGVTQRQQPMVSAQPSNNVWTACFPPHPLLTATVWATVISHLNDHSCRLGSLFLPNSSFTNLRQITSPLCSEEFHFIHTTLRSLHGPRQSVPHPTVPLLPL